METLAPEGGIVSGDLMIVGQVAGIAVFSAAAGEPVILNTEGVYERPKASGAIAQGAKVYWNATDKNVVTTATGNTYIGIAWLAAATTDEVVNIKLNA